MKKFLAAFLALTLFAAPGFAAKITPDTYDKLFLRMDGTTTSFVDSSTSNPKSITANGNATQLSLHADFAGKRTAGFFNGTTDYVVVPDSADWDFGTGAFSIECYVNFASVTSPSNPIIFASQAYNNGVYLAWDNTNFDVYINSAHYTFAHGGRNVNQWYKIKLDRDGSSNLKMYKDDVQVGTTQTSTENISGMTAGFGIGNSPSPTAGQYLNGWIKNFTVTKAGTTVLDMKFDSPATSPLGPSLWLDGNSDAAYVTNANKGTIGEFGTGAFTIEGWFKWDSAAGIQDLWDWGQGGTRGTRLQLNSGALYVTNMTTAVCNYTFAPVVGKWYHIAVVRETTAANKTHLFIDGQLVVSGTSADNISTSTDVLALGSATGRDGSFFPGNIREFRVSNVARYTATFTPSQSSFTVDANTLFYPKFNENNGVTTFVDSSSSPITISTAGTAQIKYTEDYRSCIFKDDSASAHKPYPQGSAKVDFFTVSGSGVYSGDGSTSCLSIANHADFKIGTGEVTAETYVRPEALADTGCLFDMSVWPTGGWGVFYNSDLDICTVNGATSNNGTDTNARLLVNTWAHVAWTRAGGLSKIWLNGTEVYSVADTYDFQQTRALEIGVYFYTYNSARYDWLKGRLDNIRISKGIARYTSTFNPPEDVDTNTRRRGSHFFFF